MTYYSIEEGEMTELSQQNDRAMSTSNFGRTLVGAGFALLPQPFFAGYPKASPSDYCFAISWVVGPLMILTGVWFLNRAKSEKGQALSKLERIKRESTTSMATMTLPASGRPQGRVSKETAYTKD